MKKRLLLAFMAMSAVVSSLAVTINTKTGCYVTTGDNICTNGNFVNADFTGWTPVSATAGTECSALFSYSAENLSISSTSNLFSEGMYYKFNASSSEPYVVSFKIRQVEGAWPYSTNVLYTSSETDNVTVNTYGCSGTNGAGKNFISLFGTNGGVNSGTDFINAGYAIQLTADWQDVAFATVPDGVTRDWYLYICNMAQSVEIKDIAIYPAVEVADARKAAEPLAFAKAVRDANNWPESDELTGLKENIENVEGINTEMKPDELTEMLEGLQDALNEFISANLDDYISTCAVGTKWADVSTKGQKIKTIGDWKHFFINDSGQRDFNTDRMMHCNNNNQAEREAMAYWLSMPDFGYGSALGLQGLIMTKELKAGSYIFALKGNSHTNYQSNTPYTGANGYISNDGWKQAKMTISIENAAGETIAEKTVEALPALWDEYGQAVVVANVPSDGEYSFVVNLSQPTENSYYGTNRAFGGSYYLCDPQIYCKLEGYNAKQLAYIDNVKAQINAGRTNYDTAIEYQANVDYLWGKADLKACTDTMLVKLEAYEALDDAAIVATFDETVYEAGATKENALLEHEVYVELARDLIAANRKFIAVNDTLASLATAIANAKEILAARVYGAAVGKTTFETVISDAETLNTQLKGVDYSEENAAAIVAKIDELKEAAETFKASVPAECVTVLADIDFAAEAVRNDDGTATIAGAVNSILLPNFNTDDEDLNNTNSYFYQGFWNNAEKVCADMLRVGNGEGIVAIDEDKQVAGTDILKLTFDYYFARLMKTNAAPGGTYSGFYLYDADKNKIAQLYYSAYFEAVASEENNTFGLNLTKKYLPSVGASTAQNDAIAAAGNVTHFEIILDYGLKTMYCITTTSNGTTQTSEKIAFDGAKMASFAVVSSHENTARRCWFDNLKIERIATEAPALDGISEVNAAAKVKAPTKVLKNGRIIINGKYAINGMLVK
ncbi:hypothetical protein [uncultured Prevotella sp.]|uniref:hypothetical protein n=1 Tax=uncultured Prevotella sp. TaxID=159272 RepID=UPI00259079BC|nr:hypothetical protein [uncultured Prevotella sp.]